MATLSQNEAVICAVRFLALSSEQERKLLDSLDKPEQALADILSFTEKLHRAFGGCHIDQVIRATLSVSLTGAAQEWYVLGCMLLSHGHWRATEDLASRLEHSFPAVACALRTRLLIEKSQSELASKMLARCPGADPAKGEWLELEIRLALLSSQQKGEPPRNYLGNPAISYSLQARVAGAFGKKEAMLPLVSLALQQTKPDAEALWLRGLLAADSNDRDLALDCWQKALLLRPRYAACLYDRGRFRLLWGDAAGGESDLIAALEVKPWAGRIAIDLAQRRIREKKYAAALKFLDLTLQANENQPEVIALSIDCLRFQGAPKLGEALAEKAKLRYPTEPNIWLAYGALLQDAGKKDQAINAYQIASNSPLHAAAVKNNLGRLLLDEGDLDGAIAEWEDLHQQAGNNLNISIATNLAHAYRQRGDIDEANALFDEILERHFDNADAARGKAACAMTLGNQKEALAFAEVAMKNAPHDVRSYLAVARAKLAVFRANEAIAILNSGLDKVENVFTLLRELWTILIQRHEYQKALDLMLKARRQFPKEVQYCLMAAESLNRLNRFDDCLEALREAKKIDRDVGGRALVAYLRSRSALPEALAEANLLLEANPSTVRMYGLVAEVLYKMERYEDAASVLRRGVALDPQRVAINKQLIGQLLAQERFDEALAAARSFLAAKCSSTQYLLCIEVLRRSRRYQEAYEMAEQFLQFAPHCNDAYLAVAGAAERLKLVDRGMEVLKAGLLRHPGNITMNRTTASFLSRNELFDRSVEFARHLLASDGHKSAALTVVGAMTLIEGGKLDEAGEVLENAKARFKDNKAIYGAVYTFYRRSGQDEKAHQLLHDVFKRFPQDNRTYQWVFDEYVKYKKIRNADLLVAAWESKMPGEWAPLFAKLVLAEKKQRIPELLGLAAEMLAKWPDEPEILSKLANAYSDTWRLPKAIELAEQASQLRPDNIDYLTQLIATLAKAGDFDRFEQLLFRLEKLLGDKKYLAYAGLFFLINCHPDFSLEKIYRYYELFGKRGITPSLPPQLDHSNAIERNRRLRIGYVSPDFRQHAVAYFTEPLLVEHDRQQFELYAFAVFEPGQQDETTERFKTYFHHWIDISALSADEIYSEVRKHKIDILVDLAGHTKGSRLLAMTRKPAPIQASSVIGSGQTSGVEQIDYLIADEFLIPKHVEKYCTEHVARVAWTGYPYAPPPNLPDVVPPPCIKNGHITFATFTRPIRLSRQLFAVWAKILLAMPDARLRLDHIPYSEPEIQRMLRDRFSACGGNPEQIVFASTRPHWNAFAEVDIVLDTFPTGSATTAVESLYMGVPVISLDSRPLMGRYTLAQIMALGLGDVCGASHEEGYISKALTLASDVPLLSQLRQSLRQRFAESPMMDYKGHGKAVALLYRQMWHDWCEQTKGLTKSVR